ncbi:hypothetical protein SAMN06272771_7717 [Streptomyces sp. Ag82_O1-12]|uniref:hypothetical protein n=1 Tax=unclassified Streptomyces TaxID=2593676 RepID=UPI000BD6A377|nr:MULTISPECIES: hypothetical protein [unclassified Streptomyces]SMQ21987.1 hypothetical protein SAMN06272771_7717 [Streptomyces sp. Ag82_O1-12]SOE08246.1 hypothetical protein SAMN06272727_7738 [Streptomyces sp. Ag82_G6-1]
MNVGSSLSAIDDDEDEEFFINDLVGRLPYGAEPVDPARLPTEPRARLDALLEAMQAADAKASLSVRHAKARWTIEKGIPLGILVDERAYEAAGYTALEPFADEVLHISRGHVYELVGDARRLVAVAPLSEISDKPLVPSQAKVLAPILELESGMEKARKTLLETQQAGKVTAATLKRTAVRLGYAAKLPGQASADDAPKVDPAELAAQVNRELHAAASAAERAVALLTSALASVDEGVAPADSKTASVDLSRLRTAAERIARRADRV